MNDPVPVSKPGLWWFALAPVVLLVGVGLFVWVLYCNITGLYGALTRVVAPGEREILCDKPGTYTVFHEYRSTVNGRIYVSGPDVAGLTCKLTSVRTGVEVPPSGSSMTSAYNLPGRSGVSLMSFHVYDPGTYTFSAHYDDDADKKEIVLTIGTGFMRKILGTVFGGIVILLGSFAAAVLIVVVTAVRRSRADRRASAA